MKSKDLILRKRMYLSIQEDLTQIETALLIMDDPVVRKKCTARLARIDQKMAALRSALIEAGWEGCPG